MSPQKDWFDTNFYDVLGVSEKATEKEISAAYKKLARQYHPDANSDPGAEEKFKAISAAHDVIGDAERRKEYDEVRRLGPMGRGGPGAGPGGVRFESGDLGDIGGLFGDLFGRFGGQGPGGRAYYRSGPWKGADLNAHLMMDFEDAVKGIETTLFLTVDRTQKDVKVRIPAGVADGQTIRIPGKGGPGHDGGPAGDLFVEISVGEHELFGRSGRDLTITAPISYSEACLGADIKVPTLGGSPVTVRLPAGTRNGRTFRVKGKGVSAAKPGGDLLVTVEVAVPQNLSAEERRLVEALAEAESSKPSPRQHFSV